jgi:predicted amidohydrolase
VSPTVRVGIAQWTPGPETAANLATAEAALHELGRHGCQLAVLPELWLCGYRAATLAADASAAAEPLDGKVQRRLAAAAQATGMVVCAGTFPEVHGGELFNTAVIYGPDGELIMRHRKTCLYGCEPAVFQPGNAVTAGDIAGIGRVGLCICFDGDFPEAARALRRADAGIVLHPSAYEAAMESWWDTIYPAQALCNGQWWISANLHGGVGADRMLGGSRVIGPDGPIAAG